MKETKKINKAIVIVIILLILIILSLIGYIIYDKIENDKTKQNLNNITTSSTITNKSNKLSDKELEEYLSYVPISNFYENDAYSGKKIDANKIEKNILYENVINKCENIKNINESISTKYCNEEECKHANHYNVSEFYDKLKTMYNINGKTLDITDFDTTNYGVSKTNNYLIAVQNSSDTRFTKVNKIKNYKITENELIIYEQAGLIIEEGGFIGIYKYHIINDENPFVKKYQLSNDEDESKLLDYYNSAKEYIEENINDFNTYKHTFKLNENNNYYWYSTELSN